MGRAGAGLRPESYLQPYRRLVPILLRICFDFFDYTSILFLRPEVFTEHGMRPGQHGHRERTTGCPAGQRCTAQGGAASTGNGGHGRAAPCSGSGNGHWAGFGTELGSGRFGRLGRFVRCVETERGGVEWRGWPGRAQRPAGFRPIAK
jgi:hypothetical protein